MVATKQRLTSNQLALCLSNETCAWQLHRPSRGERHSLVLQQLVLLPQLAQLAAYGALGAAQRADLAAQVLLDLAAGLQVCLQLLHILLQPEAQRGRHGFTGGHRAGEIDTRHRIKCDRNTPSGNYLVFGCTHTHVAVC